MERGIRRWLWGGAAALLLLVASPEIALRSVAWANNRYAGVQKEIAGCYLTAILSAQPIFAKAGQGSSYMISCPTWDGNHIDLVARWMTDISGSIDAGVFVGSFE